MGLEFRLWMFKTDKDYLSEAHWYYRPCMWKPLDVQNQTKWNFSLSMHAGTLLTPVLRVLKAQPLPLPEAPLLPLPFHLLLAPITCRKLLVKIHFAFLKWISVGGYKLNLWTIAIKKVIDYFPSNILSLIHSHAYYILNFFFIDTIFLCRTF